MKDFGKWILIGIAFGIGWALSAGVLRWLKGL